MAYEIALGSGDAHGVDVARHGGSATIAIDGREYRGSLRPAGDGYELTLEDRTEPIWLVVERDTVHAHAFGRAWTLTLVDPVERARSGGVSEDVATAPMPGTVLAIAVTAGQEVAAGERLVTIESMKMQSEIAAGRAGVVDRVLVAEGDTFDRGAPLVALAPEDAGEDGEA